MKVTQFIWSILCKLIERIDSWCYLGKEKPNSRTWNNCRAENHTLLRKWAQQHGKDTGSVLLLLCFPFLPELQIALTLYSPTSSLPHSNLSYLQPSTLCPSLLPTVLRIQTQNNPSAFASPITEIWTLPKIKQLWNVCHYMCIVYKLSLVNIFMHLDSCHSYVHSRGVKIGVLFSSPTTQTPFSTGTWLSLSHTHAHTIETTRHAIPPASYLHLNLSQPSVQSQSLTSPQVQFHQLQKGGLQTKGL